MSEATVPVNQFTNPAKIAEICSGSCVDETRMNAVLRKFKSTLTWEQISKGYEEYLPPVNKNLADTLTFDEIRALHADLFFFSSNDIEGCRNDLSKFIAKNWRDFHAKQLNTAIEKMRIKRDKLIGSPYVGRETTHINLYPQYGAAMQPSIPSLAVIRKQQMVKGLVPYALTGEIPAGEPTEEEDAEDMPRSKKAMTSKTAMTTRRRKSSRKPRRQED